MRINQLYEQAKWSVLLEEIEHTEVITYLIKIILTNRFSKNQYIILNSKKLSKSFNEKMSHA